MCFRLLHPGTGPHRGPDATCSHVLFLESTAIFNFGHIRSLPSLPQPQLINRGWHHFQNDGGEAQKERWTPPAPMQRHNPSLNGSGPCKPPREEVTKPGIPMASAWRERG